MLQAPAEAGRRIDARVVAQGVETASELRTLAVLDVPLGRGWLRGRPAARWPRVDAAVAGNLRRAHH